MNQIQQFEIGRATFCLALIITTVIILYYYFLIEYTANLVLANWLSLTIVRVVMHLMCSYYILIMSTYPVWE